MLPTWTSIALVMTVLMGGIIAYNGDLIGRKYGKRRVSLFGLRPRHTAILITSLTGVVISALTTGALFLLVPPVRAVILQGEEALRLNIRYKKENALLDRMNRDERQQNAVLSQRNQTLEQNLEETRQRYTTASASLKRAQESLDHVQQQLRDEQEQVRIARAAQQEAMTRMRVATAETQRQVARNTRLRERNGFLAAANVKLAEQNTALTRASIDLNQANAELTRTNSSLKEANADLQQRNAAELTKNRAYQQQNEEIGQQNQTLLRNNEALLRVNRQYRDENNGLRAENEALVQSRLEVFGKNRSLTEMFEAMRTRRVVIHGGEDLARRVVPSDSSPDDVRHILQELMHDASVAALAKGAAPGDQARAVQVVDKQFFTQTRFGVIPVEVKEQDRIDALVNRLSRQPASYAILALAVANSVEREPAAIDFQPFPNQLIYSKGQVVAERRLDGTQSADHIFSDLVGFLKDLGHTALDRGMIPRIDPGTGEPQVGSLRADDIVKLVERVRTAGRRVRVRALAASDVRAADSLELDFRLDPTA